MKEIIKDQIISEINLIERQKVPYAKQLPLNATCCVQRWPVVIVALLDNN